MSFTMSSDGSFRKTEAWLKKLMKPSVTPLDSYAQAGVNALQSATPVESGLTANSWSYDIKEDSDGVVITWNNSNIVNGVPIAIILQYGHGTGTGGYVAGRNYINPALKPIFDKISEQVWKAVKD